MIKRILTLCLCVCLMLAAVPASANSWGLKGALYNAVSSDSRWNDYTTLGKQCGNAAVMQSRYHNALMLLEDGELRVYTTAVWQPEDGMGVPKLSGDGRDTLTIEYGDETFYFVRRDGVMQLEWAETARLRVDYTPKGYRAKTDYDHIYFLARDFLLQDFNIRLFPRHMDEAIPLMEQYAYLASGRDVLGWYPPGEDFGTLYSKIGKGNVPVYSAPDKKSWRAANGKAAVSLKGDLWLLRMIKGEDGKLYACIRYEVSQRTQRIGWIEADKLALDGYVYEPDEFINVELATWRNTYLTDDPLCSQFRQIFVPSEMNLTCIGLLNNDYAYVKAQVKDGEVVEAGGQTVWGFVPLRDLVYARPWYNIAEMAMEALEGYWSFEAGGNMAWDTLTLHESGLFIGNMGDMNFNQDEDSAYAYGLYHIYTYDASQNLYWNDPTHMIEFDDFNGHLVVRGLTWTEDTFTLTDHEGGGGYRRVPENELPEDVMY
ncbi:MAG: hypothetical protein IKK21_01765 [Clostridia bacterium]|nr:hypothetical protein [Clostridia bacterium]